MFNHFRQSKLFAGSNSGFIPGNSSVAQLLSINHEIYKSFDCSPTRDIGGVFLNISKPFDTFWHKGLLFELQPFGIEVNLLRLLKNYLMARQQRAILNGQT